MTEDRAHHPVLVDEVIEALDVRPDGNYVDATYGRGGHTAAILERLGAKGRVLAIDRDPQAVEAGRSRFAGDARVTVIRGRFSMLKQHLEAGGMTAVDAVLMDLGVSSPQIDAPDRGFSFMRRGPLDMRMDPDSGAPLSTWLGVASQREIQEVLERLGEERFARRIAAAIVEERQQHPIEDTETLARIVARAVPTREAGKHPATRTFQALRMHVNQEVAELTQALEQSVDALAPGGRLAVISFHSIEDRIVKQFMRAAEGRGPGSPRLANLPVVPTPAPRLTRLGRPIRPSARECSENVRARSAVLRVAVRVPANV
ncbi:MAG: 16S rRNA (cytosine(1402)-N(4))-methyltransferase RsmH [Acidiferrobacteraceae bacterium]